MVPRPSSKQYNLFLNRNPQLTHSSLTGGISLPTLFFHDDESPFLTKPSPRDRTSPRSQWGFPPFLTILQSRATLLRSRLLTSRHNISAELWLVNPSKADREVHEKIMDEQPIFKAATSTTQSQKSATPPKIAPYPPRKTLPSMAVLAHTTPRETLMTGLSSITTFSRKVGQQILSNPLAQPVVPHLPLAVRSLINVPGEWERSDRLLPKTGPGADVANEFESARLYLARWARVVAEEGERARRKEIASQANLDPARQAGAEDMAGSLGVFSLLASPNSKRPLPQPTRTPQHPITSRDWASFVAQGRDELWVRREIFKRGFSDSVEPEEKAVRREGWQVLLGIVPWGLGGVGAGQAGKERRRRARGEARTAKMEEYATLKKKWQSEAEISEKMEVFKEEWHRIDVSLSSITVSCAKVEEFRLIADEQTGTSQFSVYLPMLRTKGAKKKK